MNSCKTKPNSQANRIAEKKDGTLIPKVLITEITLSKIVSLYKADKIPKNIPITIAIVIAEIAKIAVLGKVSEIISETFLSFFWNDFRKYGYFKTSALTGEGVQEAFKAITKEIVRIN